MATSTIHECFHIPTGPFPAARRASLISVIIEPTTGAEHDVPKTRTNSPATAAKVRFSRRIMTTVHTSLTDGIVCASQDSCQPISHNPEA